LLSHCSIINCRLYIFYIFFLNYTSTTEIYTLSLHDALPIWYSGKKKRHTFKFQLSMHYTTGEILSVCGSHGSMHDFKIFKKSMRKLKFKPFFIVDKGYLGIK